MLLLLLLAPVPAGADGIPVIKSFVSERITVFDADGIPVKKVPASQLSRKIYGEDQGYFLVDHDGRRVWISSSQVSIELDKAACEDVDASNPNRENSTAEGTMGLGRWCDD